MHSPTSCGGEPPSNWRYHLRLAIEAIGELLLRKAVRVLDCAAVSIGDAGRRFADHYSRGRADASTD